VFRIKYQESLSYKPNADTSHLLDSLVSALAVYATAFRSKLSLRTQKQERYWIQIQIGGGGDREEVDQATESCNGDGKLRMHKYGRLCEKVDRITVRQMFANFLRTCYQELQCSGTLYCNKFLITPRLRNRRKTARNGGVVGVQLTAARQVWLVA